MEGGNQGEKERCHRKHTLYACKTKNKDTPFLDCLSIKEFFFLGDQWKCQK